MEDSTMGNQSKVIQYIEAGELPAYFRALADAIETGEDGEFACASDFKKFKITGKLEFGKVRLKTKFKSEQECVGEEALGLAAEDKPTKPDYKTLKKRMRSSFKMLLKMVHDGQIPPQEAVDSFLEDSALMVTYAGYGDEYYDSYTQACDALKTAHAAGDIEKMHTAVDVLIHEKSRCHANYD